MTYVLYSRESEPTGGGKRMRNDVLGIAADSARRQVSDVNLTNRRRSIDCLYMPTRPVPNGGWHLPQALVCIISYIRDEMSMVTS